MVLELKDIKKSFGEKRVLEGISLRAESGRAFGLLGRNGAGKTTAIRILMNVFPADSGTVLTDGRPADYDRLKIGYLPEERGLYPKKEIADQLVYFARLKGLTKSEAQDAVNYWLDRLSMGEYRNRRLDTLSKGNQQKIQLITAIAHDPDIIILDEPFSGLDPVNAMLLEEVVKEQIQKGKTVLFSSHQMNYIEEFCDNIAILSHGKIAVSGGLHEIKRNYLRDRLVVRTAEGERLLSELGDRVSATENRDEYIIKLDSPDQKNEAMKRITANYDVDEIKVFEPSLNDIFVEYAGDGAPAGGAV